MCGDSPARPRRELPAVPAMALPDTVRVRTGGRIVRVPLEDYVLGTALSEVSPVGDAASAATRIFEVQAVIARTYAVSHLGRHRAEGFDLCDETHCQLYQPARVVTSRFAPVAVEPSTTTRGQVARLRTARPSAGALSRRLRRAHRSGAGRLGRAPVPYLTGAPDDVPADTHRTWRSSRLAERVRAALNARHESSGRSRVSTRRRRRARRERPRGGRRTPGRCHADAVEASTSEPILNQHIRRRAPF